MNRIGRSVLLVMLMGVLLVPGASSRVSQTGFEIDTGGGDSEQDGGLLSASLAIVDPQWGSSLEISGGITRGDGTMRGAGFTPNMLFGVIFYYVGPGFFEVEEMDLGYTDANGSFKTVPLFQYCSDARVTSIGIGISQTAVGRTYFYGEFPLSCT